MDMAKNNKEKKSDTFAGVMYILITYILKTYFSYVDKVEISYRF